MLDKTPDCDLNMPRIWRYLLLHYLRVMFLCIVAFVAILLTTRLKEIAHFATLGPQASTIGWFIFYQIPYVLPIAMPLSALIAAIILVRNLSESQELTALRAAGFSLPNILAPVLIAAVFLSMGNFYIVSEMATHAHLATNVMKNELRAINPLLLLGNNRLMRMRGLYFEALGASHVGEYAEDAFLAIPSASNSRLALFIAKKVKLEPPFLVGQNTTLVSTFGAAKEDTFENLLLENIVRSETSLNGFSTLMQSDVWAIDQDYLPLSALLTELANHRQELHTVRLSQNKEEIKNLERTINSSFNEILRRLSIALALLTFTGTGLAFGIKIGRRKSHWNVISVVFLAAIFIALFFAARGITHNLWIASVVYGAPHLLMLTLSLFMLRRVNQGIES